MDVRSEWPILLWPLFTLITWMVVAKCLARLLAGGSPAAERDDAGQGRAGSAPQTHTPAGATPPDPTLCGNGRRPSPHPSPARQPASTRSPMRQRCAPRSLRGQITLLATVITVLTLLATGTGIYLLARTCAPRWRAAPHSAAQASAENHPRMTHGQVRSHVRDAGPAAVVVPGRHAESSTSRGAGAAAAARPPSHGRRAPEPHAGRLHVPVYAATRVTVDTGHPGLAWPRFLELIVALETAELITLNTWTTWKVTGRLLRPVEEVSAELSEIDFSDLTTRVSEPRNAREITRLCHAINKVLGRLNTTMEELEETSRRQQQFASDVSHELRSPIAGLRAQLEAEQLDPGRTLLPELLRKLLGQVDRLQTITDDLLCLGRVRACPPAERRRLDLAALVQFEIAQRTDRLPGRLRLTHGTTVIAVPSQISRLFANLLDNARRHSAHLVCVEVRSTPGAVELVVSDDGPGIAEADRERVFNRFTRLEDARRLDHNGSGLGLAIARDIAQAHQGTLSVEESTVGGARFVLRLPRVRSNGTGSS
ncbi:hypothetical protein GCM10023194_17510 [Planotetraspora phitsanulokensis]|uniref:histidine kinase n=1 Tax=Planotetraspora phitsanulokensis TaxID=575192 RepID=A0A8J3U1C1_9ACTN|nr:HAMP domain-containing sensor histidine kinase [Planotetraspora phitsanulokensis]GII35112.1 hypothetical protein Pph01_01150 [Planotetraspora phitsanulokensis]